MTAEPDELPYQIRVADCGPNLGVMKIEFEMEKTELAVGEWLDVTVRFYSFSGQPVKCFNPVEHFALEVMEELLVSGDLKDLEFEGVLLTDLGDGVAQYAPGTATGVSPPTDDEGALRFKIRSTASIEGVRIHAHQAPNDSIANLTDPLSWVPASASILRVYTTA